jgi:hypothetical protein
MTIFWMDFSAPFLDSFVVVVNHAQSAILAPDLRREISCVFATIAAGHFC